ncbi:MAG: DNA cytosine methyltransferase [Prevotella sp.]|nr:DNA cytosine methyltransferase [Prevotella sp.]
MTHASVFSGIGGPEVAATMLGWENLFHCEINPFGRKVLDYWYPNSKSYEDITTTDFREWRGRVDVLTGGFPCQPFSYAGRRRGAEDDRYLWPSMYRAIDEIEPTWVVAENVAGILTMVEQGEVSKVAGAASLFDASDDLRGRYELRETFTLQRICSDLESHGYAVQPVLVPACAVGAPHRRDRVFIVARRVTADTDSMGRREGWCEESQRQNDRHNAQVFDIVEGQGSSGTTADTSEPRAEGVRQKRQDAVHRPEPTADTDCWRGFEVEESVRLWLADGNGLECTCGQRTFADTDGIGGAQGTDTAGTRPGTDDVPGQTRRGQGHAPERHHGLFAVHGSARQSGGVSGCNRWQWTEDGSWLPTQSPIHRGNDGLPFDMDRLTLSFGKWRTEALKAYGNAIVPQVMYEIFRAIEIVEQR